MKFFYVILAAITALIAGFVGIQTLASERVEVVELHTTDSSGKVAVTRLWIVDHEGHAYLRAGHDKSDWYLRLKSRPGIKLIRNDETLGYQALATTELQGTINQLMREKYTWGDTYIGSLFDRGHSIPIKLVPQQTL